jgi:hypothetical protein
MLGIKFKQSLRIIIKIMVIGYGQREILIVFNAYFKTIFNVKV